MAIKFISLSILLLISQLGLAAKPVFLITPVVQPPAVVSSGQIATASYQVTNNTNFILNGNGLRKPPAGLTQTVAPGACANPFNLAPGESCLLQLQITADAMQGNILGGPVICNTASNPIYCSKPTIANELKVFRNSASAIISITSGGRTIQFDPVVSLNLQITNNANSPVDALSVTARLPAGWTGVTVNDSNCARIAPGASCTLSLTSATPYVADLVTISGSNTVNPAPIYIAFTASNGYVFAADGSNAKIVTFGNVAVNVPWGNPVATGATSLIDGDSNTNTIVTTPGIGTNAAQFCVNLAGGDWYLPAICEIGPVGGAANCPPNTPNIIDNLIAHGFSTGFTESIYWSSTEISTTEAWAVPNLFSPTQVQLLKSFTSNTSTCCVRIIPY